MCWVCEVISICCMQSMKEHEGKLAMWEWIFQL